MEPISLILAALLAGTATGFGQSATQAVTDAYQGLRDALRRRLAKRPAAQDAVEQFLKDPQAWKDNLAVHLQQADADGDPAILDAATRVIQLADPAGRYVNIINSWGVQQGIGNSQINYFGPDPAQASGPHRARPRRRPPG